jgi:hypothetical protein
MIRITIGANERDIGGVTPGWVREHVQDLRARGIAACVRISIEVGSMNMILSTPCCPSSEEVVHRPYQGREKEIFEWWEKRGLNRDDFDVNELIAFIDQIRHL